MLFLVSAAGAADAAYDQYFRLGWDCSNDVLVSTMIVFILISVLVFTE